MLGIVYLNENQYGVQVRREKNRLKAFWIAYTLTEGLPDRS